MGLEGVELILRIEEAFGIDLPEGDMGDVRTVGDLHRVILGRIQLQRSQRCLIAHVFYRLRRTLTAVVGCDRRTVRPRSSLADVVPAPMRRRVWPSLQRDLGLRLPMLRRPPWLVGVLTVVIFVVSLLTGIELGDRARVPMVLSVVSLGVAFSTATALVTRPLAVCIVDCPTVGDVARRVLRDNIGAIAEELGEVNSHETWHVLRDLIVDELQLDPARLHPETLIRDLGL